MSVTFLKSLINRTTGVPIGAFYLTTMDGNEMYDVNCCSDFGLDKGDVVKLKTWLEWDYFLRYAIMGFTTGVVSEIEKTRDEKVVYFQKKVAMMISAHFGHDDLAEWTVNEDIPSHQWIGDHPYRDWCKSEKHILTKTTPVHEAAKFGQLRVLKRFVLSNAFTVTARDGDHLLPLSIALRNKQRPCAGFLLARSWARVEFEEITIPISLCARIKYWAQRAKVKVYAKYGPGKSSLKKKPFINTGILVGNVGINIDGFPKRDSLVKRRAPPFRLQKDTKDDPDTYFNLVSKQPNIKLRKLKEKLGKLEPRRVMIQDPSNNYGTGSRDSGRRSLRPSSGGHESATRGRLPTLPAISSRAQIGSSNPDLPSAIRRESRETSRETSLYQTRPKLGRLGSTFDSKMTFIQTATRDVQIDETLHENEQSTEEQRIQEKKELKRLQRLQRKASTISAPISLPEVSLENKLRPFFHARNASEDPKTTMRLFEKYRGMKARDYAIQSLSIASTFKDKPWLKQVRMAMTFAEFGVKRAGRIFHGKKQVTKR